jgi:hypothetical protein
VRDRHTLRAVLFDLDDTLFDHRHAARSALFVVYGQHAAFTARAFSDLERAHTALLQDLHEHVMAGTLDLDDARVERFRRLLLPRASRRTTISRSRRQLRIEPPTLPHDSRLPARQRSWLRSDRACDSASCRTTCFRSNKRRCGNGLAGYIDALVVSERQAWPSRIP